MPEFNFSEFETYLDQVKNGESLAPVYLFHGDEYLFKTKTDDLLNQILPGKKKKHNHEAVDGATANMGDVVERLSTYSMFSGLKVVSLTDARVFYSKQDKSRLLEQAKEKADQDDLKAASAKFIQFLSMSGLSLEDVETTDGLKQSLTAKEFEIAGGKWCQTVIEHCVANGLTVPAYVDDSTILQTAIERGFPKKHHLVISTDLADKRRVLYKLIKEKGVIVDCSVPKGDRRADNDVKLRIFREAVTSILSKHGKQMEPAAFDAILKMAGFELRVVTGNIEKLIQYIGTRDKITVADVSTVLKRTKKDPIYELTEAVSTRKLAMALFYLNSMFSDGEYHPLQILTALINQVRKLLVAKDFVMSPYGKGFHAGIQFNQFKSAILNNVIEFDRELAESSVLFETEGAGKKTKNTSATAGDLSIVKNPKSPYPVYLLMLKSENFSKDELVRSYEALYEADVRLKSSDIDPQLFLEKTIVDICRK